MDRFDESTRDRFPADRFLGGLRLLEPGRGRRVAPAGGRRAVFDGPFLESAGGVPANPAAWLTTAAKNHACRGVPRRSVGQTLRARVPSGCLYHPGSS
jgi:hypothetical protein